MKDEIKYSSDLMNTIKSLESEIDALKKENQRLIYNSNLANTNTEAHREYDARFKTIFEFSRLGNKVITADLTILQVNPAMVALLGYSEQEEIIGTRILDYSPPDHHKHWELLQDHLWQRSTQSFSLETCLIKKDGSIIWCHVTSILFPDKGELLGYTIIEDITEQHYLRIQKEEFISIASHELKTPITSLKAVLQLMNHMIKNETVITEKIIKLGKDAELYTNKLTNLVGDLLNSTKIAQGQLSLNKINFPLSQVIEGCCNHVRLDDKHYISHDGDLSLEVYADKQKIDQILVNFVNNAVKYAPESEEILIGVENLDGCIKISVTDRGQGIPPEIIPHLFDRYYQANKEGNHNAGLGLGLYISSEIIKRHGGEMGVESKLGQGATFWFTIPHATSHD